MTPLERAEALYADLVRWYGDGRDRELRAATKLLMVALDRLRANGGEDWQALLHSYIDLLTEHPERFGRMLDAQRGESKADRSEALRQGS